RGNRETRAPCTTGSFLPSIIVNTGLPVPSTFNFTSPIFLQAVAHALLFPDRLVAMKHIIANGRTVRRLVDTGLPAPLDNRRELTLQHGRVVRLRKRVAIPSQNLPRNTRLNTFTGTKKLGREEHPAATIHRQPASGHDT